MLAGAAAVKGVAIAQLAGHPLLQPVDGFDGGWYVALATRVASGDLSLAVALDGGAYPMSPPYVYGLAAILALAGGATPGAILAVRLAQAALGVLAVWLAMRTARGWFGDAAGLIAGVLLGAAGVVTFREIVILPSALDPILMAAFVWALARATRRDAWPCWGSSSSHSSCPRRRRPAPRPRTPHCSD